LYVFQRGKPTPARIPLRFDMANATRKKIAANRGDPERDLNPRPIWHHFLANEEGLVLASPSGFWFVPMGDVDLAMARQKSKPAGGGRH
jgi:hypothetical protein